MMFDGAVAATGAIADAAHDVPHPTVAEHTTDAPAPAAVSPPAAPPPARQVVFVENDVANYQSLIAQLPVGDLVVVLDSHSDGLAQIAQWARAHQGFAAMHIISHGEANDLMLGTLSLSQANLASRQADLTTIGQALQPGGDILLYGCDIAAGQDGAAFIQSLAQDTHAVVAASTDATGAASLGGNWTLERSTGHIDVASLDLSYDGLLTRPSTGTTDFTTVDGHSTTVALGSSFVTLSNQLGWDFTMQMNTNGDGLNELIAVGVDGTSTVETVDAISDGAKHITYFSVKPNDSSLFTLNSIYVVLSGYDQAFTSGNVQLVGYLNGSAVSGATLTQSVGDFSASGANVLFNVSGISGFQEIDSFRVMAANGHNITGQVGIGNINAVNFHMPGPTITTSGGSSAYSAGNGNAVAVDSGLTLRDTATTTETTATVSITGNFHSGEDVLAFTNDGSTMGNIAVQSNSGGVLTLTSSGSLATTAQWQAALRAVTYQDTLLTPNTSTRTISFVITDPGSNTSGTVTKSVTVAADVAPAIGNLNGDSPAYLIGGGAVHLDTGTAATVTDSDSPNFNSGNVTVHISANGHSSEDVLGVDTSGTVSLSSGTSVGSTVSVGGVAVGTIASNGDGVSGHDLIVTLNGNATASRVTTLVGAFTYSNSAGSPNTATRTVQVAVNDGHGQTSSAASVTLSVISAPILTLSGGSAAFVAGDNTASTPVAVDSGLTLVDQGCSTLASATVSISGNFHSGEDVLAFTNNGSTMGNITASYNSGTGVLTLTSSGATATLAQWQAALRAVTYTDSAVTPNSATRTVSFVATDGNSNAGSTVTRTVTVADTDQTPIATTSGGSTAFTAGDNTASTPVAVDSGITVSDLDNTTLASATVSITGNFHSGEDVLAFTNNGSTMGNITASYNSGTGVLTLTSSGATATLAQWQAALRAVTYSDSAVTPNSATRTVSFSVNDGSKTSSAVTKSVTVADTDQTPIATTSGGSTAFTAGDNTASTPVAVDNGITLSDLDNSTLASATVSITGNFHSGEDVLAFTNNGSTMGNITASYNSGTGVLTLTSSGATATLAQWQAALRAVTYTDSAVTPNSATRTISFQVSDGTKASSAVTKSVTVADTDQTPIATASGGSTAFTAGDNTASTPVVVDSGITISDLDNTTLASATVSITGNFHSGEDVLAFSNTSAITFGNISASYNSGTGVLTLTSSGATATLAQWQAALRAVTYTDSAVTPNSATRTISFQVSDGSKTSSAVSKSVTVADTDQTPIATASGGSTAFTAGDNTASTPVAVDSGLTLSDLDNTTLASATVSITGNFHSGEDVLAFTNNGSTMGNIAASYNSGTGVLTLTSSGATATLAQWQAALRAVTYSDSAVTPNSATRTISFQVSDGSKASSAVSKSVTVADTDQTPVASASGGSGSFVLGADPVAVDGGITVTDLDNTTLASATVSISGNFHSSEDVLAFTNNGSTMGNIAASYNSGTGVLTLTSSGATASLAQWQAALRSVTYSDSAVTPNTATRTVSFQVSDGTKTSSTVTRSVALQLPAPGSLALSTATDTGSSHSDGVTNDTTPDVTGTAQAGATVTVYVDGSSVGTTTADGSGAWHYTLTSPLSDGNHSIRAMATLGSNNSAQSTAYTVTVDTVAPQVQSITPLDTLSTSANSLSYDVVFSKPVSGLSAGAFNTVATGSAQGTVSSVVEVSPGHYVVHLSGVGGDGSLALAVPVGAVSDAAGNSNALQTVATAYQITTPVTPPPPPAPVPPAPPPVAGTTTAPIAIAPITPNIVLAAVRAAANAPAPLVAVTTGTGGGSGPLSSTPAFGQDHFISPPAPTPSLHGADNGPSPQTFISVQLATQGPALQVLPDLGVRPLVAGQSFSFNLPPGTVVTREASSVLSIQVRQSNGQPLPGWLRFDPQTGRFSGTPPTGWNKPLSLDVTVQDRNGHRGVAHLQLKTGEPAADAGHPGKQALNEQFKQHGQGRLAQWLS
ncbi:DUF4347 domain-containing protein [Paludibacterium purpuratum]|uniref:Uncharacterized protein DUF4347 n=1 Tax=Paludibacterium purpuratum TaxID=1144873 RepID=A0A4R7B545_9NEIS|nr:DUF4347 domain-containing protein [Paludibacterium purpuratum]TDR77895.1 uncharacterized protein DUF4347 [Paludibacterium purpuratum]